MTFEELPEFTKDVKQLSKKYPSIREDLNTLKLVLKVCPEGRPPFSFRVDHLGLEDPIIKVKKIACKSLKGRGSNSGLRLIYAFLRSSDKIVLIEIYHKSSSAMENRQRILQHFGQRGD